MAKYGFGGLCKNDDELIVALMSDKSLQNSLRDMILEESNFQQQRKSNPVKTLATYSARLKKSIEKKLRHSGIEFDGPLFADDVYDANRKCMVLNFSDNTFRPNLFDTHISFLPVLYNYGWEVGNKRYPYNPSSNPTYNYYAGNYFITEAINEFNKKYGDKKLYANFMMGDMNLTLYDGNGKLPYIKRYL